MNTDNPYGQYNNYPYGTGGLYPKKSFSRKLGEDIKKDSVRKLMQLGMLAGLAILMHLLFADVLVYLLRKFPDVYAVLRGGEAAGTLFDTLYSFFCVGLPFLIVFIIYKATGLYKEPLPFGLHADNSSPLLLILGGLGVCYAGDILSSVMLQYFRTAGIEFYSYEQISEMQSEIPETVPMLILMVLRTAVIPALVEEFAFRGVIMQPLRKYGDWFAIITSAVLFGCIHGNFMQIPFAMIAGVALGYVCVVSGSMWVNIALHLLNNLFSVLYTMILSTGEGVGQMLISGLFIYGMIFIGVIALILYIKKNRNFARLYKSEHKDISGKAKFYFLMPSLAAAVILLIYEALKDIKGFIY